MGGDIDSSRGEILFYMAPIRKFRIIRVEGAREISRKIDHYNLAAILAVGYRVRPSRGVQFRRWATERLEEYLIKGLTIDDERLRIEALERAAKELPSSSSSDAKIPKD